MNGHVFDELPLLLTGEADRSTVGAVTVHLRECDDCRDELIAALAGHAALMSAAKYAPDLIAAVESESSTRYRAAPRPASASAVPAPPVPPAPPRPPDLSAVFAQVRAEAGQEPGPDAQDAHDAHSGRDDAGGARHRPHIGERTAPKASRRSTPGRRVWLSAAAAVVVLGAGGGAYLAQSGSSATPTRSVALAAYDEGTTTASAKLIGDTKVNLDASSLPVLATGSYYEVWLTNAARTTMAPVGVLGADRKATIMVPAAEMAGYDAVEVSIQKMTGVGAYSGQSVLRGSYA